MNVKFLWRAQAAVALAATLVAGAVSAQSYYITFSGAPSSIACSNTGFNLASGTFYTWNLPVGTQVNIKGTAGATVIESSSGTLGADSGTAPLIGGPMPYASIPFPYSVKYTLTPQFPGGTASGFSFDCPSATGTNFQVFNGAPVSSAIPTLSEWGLVALATLLAAASLAVLRRRRARS